MAKIVQRLFKIRTALLVVITCQFLGCNSSQRIESIVGNWYYCSRDGKYNELYVRDQYFQFCIDDAEINYPMFYNINKESDSLFFFRDSLRSNIIYLGCVKNLGNHIELTLYNDTNEKMVMQLYRLNYEVKSYKESGYSDYFDWYNNDFKPKFLDRSKRVKCLDQRSPQEIEMERLDSIRRLGEIPDSL